MLYEVITGFVTLSEQVLLQQWFELKIDKRVLRGIRLCFTAMGDLHEAAWVYVIPLPSAAA